MSYEQLNIVVKTSEKFRKYYLFKGNELRASSLYSQLENGLDVTYKSKEIIGNEYINSNLESSFEHFIDKLKSEKWLKDDNLIDSIGIRLQVPSSLFLDDCLLDESKISVLENLRQYSPTLLDHQLSTIHTIRRRLKNVKILGISDSKYHKNKPPKAWNSGIDLYLADNLDIKRFGYLGLSTEYIVQLLKNDLPNRLIICHIGESGISLTAVKKGISIENSMGYTPNDGLFSFVGSGNVDYSAIRKMKDYMNLSDYDMTLHLNSYSGLKGLSRQSSNLEEVYGSAKNNIPESKLAINTFVYELQKQIGSMVAALGGIDCLVFTGSIGTASAWLRKAVVKDLKCFGLLIDDAKNAKQLTTNKIIEIHKRTRVNEILVIESKDEYLIAQKTKSYRS
jgi:acetate kinase